MEGSKKRGTNVRRKARMDSLIEGERGIEDRRSMALERGIDAAVEEI